MTGTRPATVAATEYRRFTTEAQLMNAIEANARQLGYLEKLRRTREKSGIMDPIQEDAGAVLLTPPGVAPRHWRSAMRPHSITSLEQRFWAKVERLPSGCWRWTAFCDKAGYGRLREGGHDGPVLYAHRLSYALHKGEIPKDRELDHLCRNRWCVNPDHLDAVSHRTNVLRGVSPAARAYATDTCMRGHDLTGENVYVTSDGKRQCRSCRRHRRAQGAK